MIVNERIERRIRKVLQSAQAVTALSPAMKTRLLELGVRSESVEIIPNGIFLKDHSSARDNRISGDSYILYVGRLAKIKDLDILLHAFAQISSHHPSVKLRICGDGREMENLNSLAKDLRIDNRVDFLGTVRGDEKKRLLSEALFFVSPRIINNIGLSNLEALASGLPVITSMAGEASSVIENGKNGFLVTPGNISELAEKMELLLTDHGLRKSMAERTVSSVAEFDWSNIVKRYIDSYRTLLHDSQLSKDLHALI